MNQHMIAQWRLRQTGSCLDNKTGTILSWTKVCVAPEPFDTQVPYYLAVIALDNGTLICCPIVDADERELMIGGRVQFVTRIIHCPTSNDIITYGIKAIII